MLTFSQLFMIPATRSHKRYRRTIDSLLTPFHDALVEIKRRRTDPDLVEKVQEYLDGDIPEHFNTARPICYLSRHVATANEETLHFIEYNHTYKHGLPVIIGQDTKDIFVPSNTLKHNLGRLPIKRGLNKRQEPIIEKVTILDFNEANGKPLQSLRTLCDTPLTDFHASLLKELAHGEYQLADESDWVSRQHRGDLLAHYKKFLALMIVHGIMFELYETKDQSFVYNILCPAFEFVTKHFGCQPLITHLVPPGRELDKDWNAYPAAVYPYAQQCVQQTVS